VLKLLHARYGQPCDVVSSGPWTEPLLARVPAAGHRLYLTSRRAPYWFNRSQRALVRWLKTRPPGPVYVFESDEKPLSLLRRGGVSASMICTLRDLKRAPTEHILAHMLRLARLTPAALAGQVPDAPGTPDARPTLADRDRQDCAAWLSAQNLADTPLVLVQPGNKKTMRRANRKQHSNPKYWPEEHWARVIDGVRAALPASRVVIAGSSAERPLAEEIRRQVSTDGVIVATDDLPIPRLLALQERAHSMISVDTGPAHSAAAMGCPLVVMFAHIDPALYAPPPTSAPVKIVRAAHPQAEAPLLEVTPATVLAAWHELANIRV